MTKTIGISDETYKQLQDVGHKSETYDGIVSRLISFYLKKGDVFICAKCNNPTKTNTQNEKEKDIRV